MQAAAWSRSGVELWRLKWAMIFRFAGGYLPIGRRIGEGV
jgi:hypothetical protein